MNIASPHSIFSNTETACISWPFLGLQLRFEFLKMALRDSDPVTANDFFCFSFFFVTILAIVSLSTQIIF